MSPKEIEWLSFFEEDGHTIVEIRNDLKEAENKTAVVNLLAKKYIILKMDNAILTDEADIKTINNSALSESEISNIKISITSEGKSIYFNDPDIKQHYAS